MPSFPVSLHLRGRRVAVVGGGAVALRKCVALAAAGADLLVVAPRVEPALEALLHDCGGRCETRAYRAGDLAGAFLALAATGDAEVNADVVRDARDARVLVMDASDGERGDAHMLALARAGELTLAVDSGGAAPAFAKRVARELGERFDERYARATSALARARTYASAVLAPQLRARVLRALAQLPVERLAAMTPLDAEHEIEALVERERGGEPAARTRTAICASRASALATTQARFVASKLAERGVATTILTVTTTGDRVTDRPLDAIGSENVFVTELEAALRDRRADYAVHSCKDLPSALAADMRIVAISAREDPRDAFCSERYAAFADLPAGARVGTSSPRRRAQLAALRPDLRYDDLRGNVDTRLRKLRDGGYDAIVLAMAGLNRLRASARHTVPFEIETLVPAAAQGALAVEMRAEPGELAETLRAAINDAGAERCVTAERAALRALRAGCTAPIGVHARARGDLLRLDLAFANESAGARVERVTLEEPAPSLEDAERLGRRAAELLCAALPLAGRSIALPRTRAHASEIAAALRALGAEVHELRDGEAPAVRGPDAIVFPSSGSVAAAARFLAGLGARRPAVVAMGARSAAAATAAGWPPDVTAAEAGTEALVGAVRAHLERRAP